MEVTNFLEDMIIPTVKGAPYVVSNLTGAEIEVQSATSKVICKVAAHAQKGVYAIDHRIEVPVGVFVKAAV